ncbi:hypothetical protein BTO04_00620 [Polaribacter sp. SA4-10]|uniref:hypothetical protein n=1 Tax=Polaribacter sp. SA4-10 TaxID=754397 RepID=UPI000B3CFE27|nr:hypothetical protein [Polaribacter sp. SA4-10]ARV05284.1 hypothetical protein BTO04_00620 [Polaribacter sp. SA4-10]
MALIKNIGLQGVDIYVSTHTSRQWKRTGFLGINRKLAWPNMGKSGGTIQPGTSRYSQAQRIEKSNETVYALIISPSSNKLISKCIITPHDLAVFDGTTVKVESNYTGLTEPREGY